MRRKVRRVAGERWPGRFPYTEDFYDPLAQGCIDSAVVVVPYLIDLVQPESVVDFGCGEGYWLAPFAERGCRVVGVDGDYVRRDHLVIDHFVPHDLSQPLNEDLGRFDLAISLEVAEHLPASSADQFVDMITRHADVVLFSAALPGQGGFQHINEQWPGYWVEKFEARGYVTSGSIRWKYWDHPEVSVWYQQNMMLCVKGDMRERPALAELFDSPLAPMFRVVHPDYWDRRRA